MKGHRPGLRGGLRHYPVPLVNFIGTPNGFHWYPQRVSLVPRQNSRTDVQANRHKPSSVPEGCRSCTLHRCRTHVFLGMACSRHIRHRNQRDATPAASGKPGCTCAMHMRVLPHFVTRCMVVDCHQPALTLLTTVPATSRTMCVCSTGYAMVCFGYLGENFVQVDDTSFLIAPDPRRSWWVRYWVLAMDNYSLITFTLHLQALDKPLTSP